jgi:hypothetical protein
MFTVDSSFDRMEPCPACHISGRKETFAIYSDGHGWCFYCGHHKRSRELPMLQNCNTDQTAALPPDSGYEIAFQALEWLSLYDIERSEILTNKLLWSPKLERLIFPYYSPDDNKLLAWQGRSFRSDRVKWYGKGHLDELIHLIGYKPATKRIILVEDIVSAIKVGRVEAAMPIFTSKLKTEKLVELRKKTDSLVVWYDPDAMDNAVEDALKVSNFGFRVKVIKSKHDPKEHNMSEIRGYLSC